jgi:hypothetical protein
MCSSFEEFETVHCPIEHGEDHFPGTTRAVSGITQTYPRGFQPAPPNAMPLSRKKKWDHPSPILLSAQAAG